MAHYKEWLPKARVDRLGMARMWIEALRKKGAAWGVAPEEIGELEELAEAAEAALAKTGGPESSKVTTAVCDSAFNALVAFMRRLKNTRFFPHIFAPGDFEELGLKKKAAARTRSKRPDDQVRVDALIAGKRLLILRLTRIAASDAPLPQGYGYRINYGIVDPNAASQPTSRRADYIAEPVANQHLLTGTRYTHRARERFQFEPGDSGKRVLFSACYVNSRDEEGQFGPIESAVIP